MPLKAKKPRLLFYFWGTTRGCRFPSKRSRKPFADESDGIPTKPIHHLTQMPSMDDVLNNQDCGITATNDVTLGGSPACLTVVRDNTAMPGEAKRFMRLRVTLP